MVLVELQPSQILYSQKSIKNRFQDKNNQPGQYIEEVLDDLMEGRVKIQSIPKIEVINEEGLWISGDNRRLWIFKQLQLLGQVDTITVKLIKRIHTKKLTGISHSISIRGGQTSPSSVLSRIACCTDCQKENDHSYEIQTIQSVRKKLRKGCRKGGKSGKTTKEEEKIEITQLQELAVLTEINNCEQNQELTGNTGGEKSRTKQKRRRRRKPRRTSNSLEDNQECIENTSVVTQSSSDMTLRSGKILSCID